MNNCITDIKIPADAFFNYNLTPMEKLLLGVLYSGYYGEEFKITNASLSLTLDCSVQTIQKGIKSLAEKEYLLIKNPQGRYRELKVNTEMIDLRNKELDKMYEESCQN